MDHQGHNQHGGQDGCHQDALKIPGQDGRRLARGLCRMQARGAVAGPPQCRAMELRRKGGAQSLAQPHLRSPAQSPIHVCTLGVQGKGGSGLAGSRCFAFITLGVLGGEQTKPAMSGSSLTAAQAPSALGEADPAFRPPKQVAGALAQDQYPVEKGAEEASKEDGDVGCSSPDKRGWGAFLSPEQEITCGRSSKPSKEGAQRKQTRKILF